MYCTNDIFSKFDNFASPHALIRKQQRGLPDEVLSYLLEYGTIAHDNHGGLIYYFSRKSLKLIQHINQHFYKLCSDFKKAYIVEKDGYFVTVGHRYKKRIKHD